MDCIFDTSVIFSCNSNYELLSNKTFDFVFHAIITSLRNILKFSSIWYVFFVCFILCLSSIFLQDNNDYLRSETANVIMFEMIFLKSPQNNHPIIVELTMEISSRSQSVDFIPLDRSNDAIDTKRFEFEHKSKKSEPKWRYFQAQNWK